MLFIRINLIAYVFVCALFQMPVQKVPYAHRFGIVSTSYKDKIEKDIQRQQQESDRSSSARTTDTIK